ncbi:MAG: hypothetical protein ACI9OJ_000297 [Myxococcota bacterium]
MGRAPRRLISHLTGSQHAARVGPLGSGCRNGSANPEIGRATATSEKTRLVGGQTSGMRAAVRAAGYE